MDGPKNGWHVRNNKLTDNFIELIILGVFETNRDTPDNF